MKTKIKLRGFIAESIEEKKRIKIICNDDEFTNKIIKQHTQSGLHNPVFENGFWIKYTGKTKYYLYKKENNPENVTECTLQEIMGNHVVIEVTINNYSYPGRTGWYFNCSEIVVDK